MKPWPGISRGTECTVPIIPGLVIVPVVPAKSSGDELVRCGPSRMSSSYAAQNAAKSSVSACLMFGTSSVREPSASLDVDREPEVHVLVVHDDRLAVDAAEAGVQVRGRRAARGHARTR